MIQGDHGALILKDRATTLFLRYRLSGDGNALGRLFDLVGPEMLRVARHLGTDVAGAEDLVQSTFLSAMERAASFDDGRGVRPWLFGILIREAARTRQSEARTPDPTRLETQSAEASPLNSALEAETALLVKQTIERLPLHYREVLEPHLVHGQTAAEIALRAGEGSGRAPSSAQVRVQIARGIERLRQMLPGGLSLGAIGLVSGGRGEAAVRHAILDAARSMPGAVAPGGSTLAAASVWLPGGIIVGKALFVLLGIATAAIAALALYPGPQGAAELQGEEPLEIAASAERELVTPGSTAGASVDGMDRSQRVVGIEVAAPLASAARSLDGERVASLWTGVVLQADGAPAADAWVEVRFKEGELEPMRIAADPTTGRFTLPALAGAPYLAAYAPAHVHSLVEALAERPPGELIQLRLRGPGAALKLRILDDEGEPVHEASVSAAEDGPGGQFAKRGFKGPNWRLERGTDTEGQAYFADLLPVPHTVKISAPGHERALLDQSFQCPPLVAAEERFLEVRLRRGAVLVGRVTSVDGTPLEGSFVRGKGGDGNVHARSGADGRFELRGLLPKEQEISAGNNVLSMAGVVEILVLDAERVERWDPVLRPKLRLSGTLVDHLGEPISNWCVRAHTDSLNGYHAHGYTDSSGEFMLLGVPNGDYFVTAQADFGYDESQPLGMFREFARDGSEVRLVLPEAALELGVVKGRVVHPDGKSAGSMRLHINSVGRGTGSVLPLGLDGSFRVARYSEGEYELGFLHGEDYSHHAGGRTIRLVPGREVDLGDIVIERAGTLRIDPFSPKYPRDSGESGPQALPGSLRWAVIREGVGSDPGALADFQWPIMDPIELPPGDYTLKLQATYFRANPVRVTIQPSTETKARVVLQSATEVRFSFVTASGAVFAGEVGVRILQNETEAELQQLTVPGDEPLALK